MQAASYVTLAIVCRSIFKYTSPRRHSWNLINTMSERLFDSVLGKNKCSENPWMDAVPLRPVQLWWAADLKCRLSFCTIRRFGPCGVDDVFPGDVVAWRICKAVKRALSTGQVDKEMNFVTAKDNTAWIEAAYSRVLRHLFNHVDISYQVIVGHDSNISVQERYVSWNLMIVDVLLRAWSMFILYIWWVRHERDRLKSVDGWQEVFKSST